jgi:solute carrier family 25, member 46
LDAGYSVIPILTSYEGVVDCYKTTVATEGFSGLYKGFGSMVLQFAAHFAVIKLSKWIITQVTEICSTKPPPKVAEFYNLEPKNNSVNFTSGGSTTISRTLSGVSLMSDDA